MEIKRSTSGMPYLELLDNEGNYYGKLIFSKSTATETGYRFLCFNHKYTDVIVIKRDKSEGGRNKTLEVDTYDSFTFNMDFKRDEEGLKGVPNGMIPRRIVDHLRKIFKEFLTDDMVMPYHKMNDLEEALEKIDLDDLLKTPIRRKRKKTKKKTGRKRGRPRKIKETTIV